MQSSCACIGSWCLSVSGLKETHFQVAFLQLKSFPSQNFSRAVSVTEDKRTLDPRLPKVSISGKAGLTSRSVLSCDGGSCAIKEGRMWRAGEAAALSEFSLCSVWLRLQGLWGSSSENQWRQKRSLQPKLWSESSCASRDSQRTVQGFPASASFVMPFAFLNHSLKPLLSIA